MPETDPVTVRIEADTTNLTSGLEEGKMALRGFGDEAEKTGRQTFTLVGHSTNLLRTMLYLRAATAGTEHLMKKLGVSTEGSARAMDMLNTIMEVGIVILAAYRAALALKALAHWIAAKAAAAEAIAESGILIPILGFAIAAGAFVAAIGAIEALSAPKAQFGGFVPARPGGTIIRVGEAGRGEWITPEGRSRGGGDVNIHIEKMVTNDPEEFVRILGRKVQVLKAAGF